MVKKKICLLGSFAVGKTSLIERFVYNRFDHKYLTTIGVEVSEKLLAPVVHPVSGRVIQYTFLIWDIAGMEKFDGVVENYYRGAAGALAVADLTRPGTIADLQGILDQFLSVSPDAEVQIVGNKVDIFEQDKKIVRDLKHTAGGFSSDLFLTSAKTGERVEDAFLALAGRLKG